MKATRRCATLLAVCTAAGAAASALAASGHALSTFSVSVRIDRPGEAEGCSLSSGTGALSIFCGGTSAPMAPYPVFGGNNNAGATRPETGVPPQVVPTSPVTRTPLQVPAEPSGTQMPPAAVVTPATASSTTQSGPGAWRPALIQPRSTDVVASPGFAVYGSASGGPEADVRMRVPQGGSREADEGLPLISLVVDRSLRVQSPTVVGEYSSRTIRLGDREYLEMTVSW